MVGHKRGSEGIEEKSELGHKRVKMRDLESVFQSKGIDAHYPKSHKSGEPVDHYDSADVEMSQVTRENLTVNSNVRVGGDAPPTLDLNHDPFHPYKAYEQLKSRDAFSECGSTCGASEEKDSMRVWKEMKQNGFLSSSHGGLPMPKPRGRKTKNDGIKKKIEIAKREQVNRFAKIAAPSGLLNGLNPGIINHVRNRKQVHSIIEALVRSEKHENRHAGSKQGIQTKSVTKEVSEGKDLENKNDSGMNGLGLYHEDGSHYTLLGSRQVSTFHVDDLTGDDDSDMMEREVHDNVTSATYPNRERDDDILALKLSSSTTMASENMGSLSNEESANLTSVTSLSFKAADVASQWLELLHQDIKGRLAALRRSKKRVQAVIQTELPLLISRELSTNQENDPYITRHSAAGCSDSATAGMHRARWSALFDQMDKALSEEEKQLESSLNQIREMLLHCERGLLQCRSVNGLQLLATLDNDCRLPKVDTSEKELAVRAAAASIYSTCNFLQSMENLSCF